MGAVVRSLFLALCLFSRVQAAPIAGLDWNLSNDPFSNDTYIQLQWDGADLLPREEHTAIWRYNPHQQSGYYAVAWHSPNTHTWDFGAYSFGTHPFPATDCTVGANGGALTGAGSGGTLHCHEIAGAGGSNDWLTTPGVSPGVVVVKEQWYVQVRRVRPMASGPCTGQYEHRYIPDYYGNPSFEIVQCGTIGAAGSTPAFYFGVSDWSTNGSGGSEETLSGKLRGIQLYDAYLSDAAVSTEAANQLSNTPQSVEGIANVWYMNQNPIPSDVTDKSSAGHDPTWGNANRPIQWDSTITSNRWGIFGDNDMFLMKVGF